MRWWIAVAGLLTVAVGVMAGEPTGVQLTAVPDRVRLPLPEGSNAMLTAHVHGEARTVWLATGHRARARCLLDRVADGVYQVNLADDVVSAMLEASGPGEVRVFAEAPDGTIASSSPVNYTVAPAVGREWRRPPRVLVRHGEEVTEVTGWPRATTAEELTALAELRGQGLALVPPELPAFPFTAEARRRTGWFSPSQVQAVEVRFHPRADHVSARATVGEHEWEFAPVESGEPTRELVLTPAMREAWQRAGTLTVACSQAAAGDLRVLLKVPPAALDLPEGEAQFNVVQRHTRPVPGSKGYVLVHIGDITAG